MYKRAASGWAKHLDFIILDMICLELAFILGYMIRHGIRNPYSNVIYRNMGIVILLIDFVMLLFMETLKDVMKRGIYQEFSRTFRHVFSFILVLTAYMFSIRVGDDYSELQFF